MDMRDLYQEWKDCEEDNPVSKKYSCNYIPVTTFSGGLLGGGGEGICKELSFPEVLLFLVLNRSSAFR